jgi:tetratricopeptide (TPR) repeat protein
MASPSDDIEPETSEEEEMIEAGFDPLLFWDRYRQIILVVGGIVLLGLAGFGIYEYNLNARIAAAGAALAQASTADDYRAVLDKYPDTVAGGNAALFLAAKLRGDKKYDDAMQVLQDFMDKYPNHPLLASGDLSYAETLEAAGRIDEAVARYEEVAAKYPDSFSAPLAIIAEANIYKTQGKTEDARRLYENLVAQFPDSVFNQTAMAEMHLLRSNATAAASPAPQEGADAASNFLNAVKAEVAKKTAPTPAASAAPFAPAIPGASP